MTLGQAAVRFRGRGWCVLAVAAVMGLAGFARASGIVVDDSAFSVLLDDAGVVLPSGAASLVFNGVPQTFTGFNSEVVTVTESQTDLGGGAWEIDLNLSTTTDLFPVVAGETSQFAGLLAGPFQLSQPFQLTSVAMKETQSNLASGTFQFESLIVNPAPWDGNFVGPGEFGGLLHGANAGIIDMDLKFDGTVITPLPSAVWSGLGLLGVLAAGKLAMRRGKVGVAG